jgi:sialate O-acetylesterase
MNRFRSHLLPGWAVLGLCLALGVSGRAEVRLAGLFANGAVLQRGQPVPVWGEADPGDTVTVEFAGQVKTVLAGTDGRWTATLDPLAASAEPRVLVARGRHTSARAADVLVGEVWLLSGQSNMAYLMSAMARPSERDAVSPALAQREIESARDPLLREFRVDSRPAERPRRDVAAGESWMRWTPENGPKWAALAYFFGRRLRAELDVPVGIVMCAWGGSGCSAWISKDTLRSETLRSLWPEEVVGWRPNIAQSRLYNGMLAPLAPYAIAGFGWYQGETEAAEYHNPYLYRFLFPEMIRDWRRLWGREELPFYFVQLPARDGEPEWVVVRESQAAALRLPATVMIPALDIGQAWDLHPRNKQDVAKRFADFVLAREYRRGDWPGCPQFDRMERAGAALRLHFRDSAGGFRTTDGQPPVEFQLAGADQVFHPAEASLEHDTIVLRATAVAEPVAARYAWVSAPRINLVNAAGVAVPPFRTDDWPVLGQPALAVALSARGALAERVTGGDLLKGRAGGWEPCPDFERLTRVREKLLMPGGGSGGILVRGFPVAPGLPASPEVYWTATPKLDPRRGFTLEAKTYVTRIADPASGFEIQAGVRLPDGGFRRYRVSVFPQQVHTFQNEPGPRNSWAVMTRVLRTDVETTPATYRLAVRPDGVAQIYRDRELLGTTSGEVVMAEVADDPYLRIGKTTAQGEWAATIQHVAYDVSGAYAPATEEAGWIDLLGDGGLDHWRRAPFAPGRPVTGPSPWSYNAATGIVRCEGAGIHENLLHEEVRGDGTLRVEWRYVGTPAKPNSGLYVRTQMDATTWVQAQLASASTGILFGASPGEDGKPVKRKAGGERPELLRPPGEWNTMEITCRGPVTTLRFNGVVTAETDTLPATPGHVGLEAEGAPVEFRRILFKPAP